jgi:hypothetical protein
VAMLVFGIATAEGVAFIGAAATIIAALVLGGWAAKAARERLERELVAAGDRQEKELRDAGSRQEHALDADAKRLGAQLDHDRALTDILHLRDLLDQAAAAYEQAYRCNVRYAVALRSAPIANQWDENRGARYSEAHEAQITLATELHRIEMRFPPSHAVCSAYTNVDACLEARFTHLYGVPDDEVIGSERDTEDTKLGGRAMSAFRVFTDAVRTEIGIREVRA